MNTRFSWPHICAHGRAALGTRGLPPPRAALRRVSPTRSEGGKPTGYAILEGAVVVLITVATWLTPALAAGQNRGGDPPPTPKAAAPIDLTGYWVSIVTEDWRYRMVTPTKGDYQAVPMNADARKVADAWNPAADEAAGHQCKSYGAAAIMRAPGRVHITWQDDKTVRLEIDAGTQTRLFRFDAPPAGDPSWQGDSVAQWERPGGRGGAGRGGAPGPPGQAGAADAAPPRGGSLKVVTKNMRAGYLRKNGVPYSENAVLTEYFDLAPQRNGDQLLVVTAIVEDPKYLTQSFVVSSQFRKQADGRGWDPTPCSATW